MRYQTEENQVAVKIDRIVKQQLEDWIKTSTDAPKMGCYFVSQAITLAAREFLDKYARPPEKPTHFVMPNREDERLSLDLDIYSDRFFCNTCSAENCVHVQGVHQDKQIKKYFEKHGIEFPQKEKKAVRIPPELYGQIKKIKTSTKDPLELNRLVTDAILKFSEFSKESKEDIITRGSSPTIQKRSKKRKTN